MAKLLVLYANFPRPYEYENFLLERVTVSVLLMCCERCPSLKTLATQHYAIEHENSIEPCFALAALYLKGENLILNNSTSQLRTADVTKKDENNSKTRGCFCTIGRAISYCNKISHPFFVN